MNSQYDIRQMNEERYKSNILELEIDNQKLLNALFLIANLQENDYSKNINHKLKYAS